ncbi:coiled-coil domain-containing protein [Lonepinella sp. BR2882]|uniref:coiled-coil domain-containing protein n=1 Tax=Lonepinella sp. BR2882 TaxID=3095283 RepID=UPI003F6E264B
MSVNEFQELLLNKSEIEKILGLSINLTGNSDYEDFKMLKMIDVNDVIAIFLDLPVGIYANDIREHYRYNTIFNAICEYSENNKSDDIQVECDINGNIYNIKVSHNFARQWAITHGLSWNVPPYREINLNKETENNEEILQLQSRITELEQQLADTQKQLAELQKSTQTKKETINQSAVNNNEFFIYGHSSELLEILMKACKEFWQNYQTPPKNSVIESWIEANYPIKEYPYVSKSARQYIATILRPQPKIK